MKAKKKIKKIEELQIKIRDLIKPVTKKSDDYDSDEKYMKIKFNSDDELPLDKKTHFYHNNSYYSYFS